MARGRGYHLVSCRPVCRFVAYVTTAFDCDVDHDWSSYRADTPECASYATTLHRRQRLRTHRPATRAPRASSSPRCRLKPLQPRTARRSNSCAVLCDWWPQSVCCHACRPPPWRGRSRWPQLPAYVEAQRRVGGKPGHQHAEQKKPWRDVKDVGIVDPGDQIGLVELV